MRIYMGSMASLEAARDALNNARRDWIRNHRVCRAIEIAGTEIDKAIRVAEIRTKNTKELK